jgi:toluene monooxygenase electron transfer component
MTADGMRKVTLEPSGVTFLQAPGQRLLEAAREANVWLPFECGWGSCGTCKAALISGDIELLVDDVVSLSERDAKRGRIVMCQSSATTDVTIKPLRISDEPDPIRKVANFDGIVKSIDEVGPSIFDLAVSTTQPINFKPGQFAILHGPQQQRRCYSFAGSSGVAELRFVIKAYAGRPVSTWVSQLVEGDSVTIEGPYGDVWLRESPRPILMIAGGSGISAILALARAASIEAKDRELTVLYGARTAADLALLDELRDIVGAHGRGVLIPVVESGGPAPGEIVGRVTDALDSIDCAAHDVYLAGPPAMVDASDLVVTEAGVPRDRLFVDRFG